MILLFLPVFLPHGIVLGRATMYHPGDGFSGKHVASCNGRDPKTGEYPCNGCFFHDSFHIAHRKLLGKRGVLCSTVTHKCVETVAADTGPFGAVKPCDGTPGRKIRWEGRCHLWKTQIKLKPGWSRRGEFDLNKPVAMAIGHRAFDYLMFFYDP